MTRSGAFPDPFAQGMGVTSSPEDAQNYFQRLAQQVSQGKFTFYPPLGEGRTPATPGEARNLLSNWLVLRALQQIITQTVQPSPASFGCCPNPALELVKVIRRDHPAGG